jgi:plastocyanin
VLLAALTACGNGASAPASSSGTAAPGTAGVNLGQPAVAVSATDQLTFVPAAQPAHVGQVIQWSNIGSVLHTVTFDAYPSLSDASLQPAATWSVRFTQPGTYPYRCTIHPGMNGTLVVG